MASENTEQNLTVDQLTIAEKKILKTLTELGEPDNVTAICKAAGVSRTAYYESVKKDYFKAAWDETCRAMVRTAVPGVIQALIKKALAGSEVACAKILEIAKITTPQPLINQNFMVERKEDMDIAERFAERIRDNGDKGEGVRGNTTH